jgi:hypothetical protein
MVEIAHSHRFKAKTNGFFITPHLQELMARAGVSDVYSASNDLLEAFLGIPISLSQVYRVTHLLGEQLSSQLLDPVDHPLITPDEIIYASIDGGMVLTDEGWQEVKLGRVFSSRSRVEAGKKGDEQTRFRLEDSTYSGYLGNYEDFIPRFEASLGRYKASPKQLVFVTDGALWIDRYVGRKHPEATHILDYYHAVEHLADFAKLGFKEIKLRSQWLDRQMEHLLSDGLDEVLSNLASLTKLSTEASKSRSQLVGYYERNRSRMQYGSFRSKGLQIGSGPMEAAHRTVIQCRMKRSGQRWSEAGAQAMINLRVVVKSGRWDIVIKNLSSA